MSELLARITVDPHRMHGRPCIRDLRIAVADVLGLLSAGQSRESILGDYPYLEDADIDAALAFEPDAGCCGNVEDSHAPRAD